MTKEIEEMNKALGRLALGLPTSDWKSLNERWVILKQSLLTPSADVQERAKEIEEPDYTMSDIKEHNPDYTGNKASKDAEDYAANILTEYPDEEYVRRTPSDIRCIAEAAHLAGASPLQAENERLREALEWYADEGNYLHNDRELSTAWIGKIGNKAKEAINE